MAMLRDRWTNALISMRDNIDSPTPSGWDFLNGPKVRNVHVEFRIENNVSTESISPVCL